jgi:6-phosphogluconolactonase
VKTPVIHQHQSLDEASLALANWAAGEINSVLARKDRAVMAVPGGSTPERFLSLLGHMSLDWSRITLMPTDERIVPTGHPRSNELMLRRVFAPLKQAICGFVSFHADETDEESAARTINARVDAVGNPDIVISGMGDDGHIASLFPCDPGWNRYMGRHSGAAVLATHPKGLEPRLSLSPDLLSQARARALLISGSSKLAVLENALKHDDKTAFPILLLVGHDNLFHVFSS